MHGLTGGGWKRTRTDQGHEEERPAGKPSGHRGFVTYRQTAPPRQSPTLHRMTSGSYFPGPVRAVEIPKKGGVRVLGIPNVVDRIAQSVAVLALEPNVEKVFHDDSYGYRPGRSPVDAVRVCRERCWRKDWIVDLDVKAFFDSVPWDL